MNIVINKVTDFAREAHGDQQRKFADEPYINHPIRVMETCRQYSSDPAVYMAALLHDVLEDTSVTREQIENYLLRILDADETQRVISLVEELTDIFTKKNYPGWNRRKRKENERKRLSKVSPEAQTIKYADIIDNTHDLVKAEDFARTFLLECKSLLTAMKNGNQELHQRALARVEECLTRY